SSNHWTTSMRKLPVARNEAMRIARTRLFVASTVPREQKRASSLDDVEERDLLSKPSGTRGDACEIVTLSRRDKEVMGGVCNAAPGFLSDGPRARPLVEGHDEHPA